MLEIIHIKRFISKFFDQPSTKLPGDFRLPETRSNEGLQSDRAYKDSALELVKELARAMPMLASKTVLDFGCGQGRLAYGLLFNGSLDIKYIGVDANESSIAWCKKNIHSVHSDFEFIHCNSHNARYNPEGEDFKILPLEQNCVDVIFLNSVFSHMLENDVTGCLKDFRRVIKDSGRVYLTAHVDENVPSVTENPPSYYGRESKGALHRVVYEKSFLFDLMTNAGFEILEFDHQSIQRTLQSVIILAPR